MDDAQVAEAPADAGEAPSVEADIVNWRDDLPDDIRDHQSLATINDVNALAKGYVHAQSMIGADKIPVPGKWADDDDWSEVYSRLGRPGDSDGYEIDAGGAEVDEDFMGWFKGTAHNAGLNNRQAQMIAQAYMEMAGENAGAEQVDTDQMRAQVESDLRKEYGNAYEDRLEMGNGFIDEFGEDGLTDLVLADGMPLRNHPAFVKTLINAANFIHTNVSEDAVVGNKDNISITPKEAQAQVNELMRPDSPYWDRRHPMHQQMVDEVQELMQQIHIEDAA
jgi:hypothetical protein